MNNKQIAKHALSFIGGIPTVNRYYSNDQDKQIDVMCCKETKYAETNIYATIGLNEFDGGVTSGNVAVRIELIAVAPANSEYMGNIIASTAFEVIDNGSFRYGDIIQNVVETYVTETNLKHAVLVSPVYWDNYTPYTADGVSVSWLMIIPITDEEMKYINANGIDAFERKLAECSVDILDMKRDSLV